MNAGLLVDLPQLVESGASGIGLFRTELQFMIASTMPKVDEQEKLYRNVLRQAGDRPVTFRTLDIGGDKVVPYFRSAEEENPALGWRAIRLSLDRPGLLRTQLRALLKAAAGAELKLMLPMVTEINELRLARELLNKEVRHLSRFGHQLPRKMQFGAMLEVPSLMWQLDELMEAADFVSVGSNDLFQFMMAVDRGNSRVADRFDPLGRPFLRALRQIVEAASRDGTPLTLCGEIAGKPLSAMALLGIGYRSISMAPAAIGPVKSMLLSLDLGKLEESCCQRFPIRKVVKRCVNFSPILQTPMASAFRNE
jgi:phosphotransferase system enzyme I (PtsP)